MAPKRKTAPTGGDRAVAKQPKVSALERPAGVGPKSRRSRGGAPPEGPTPDATAPQESPALASSRGKRQKAAKARKQAAAAAAERAAPAADADAETDAPADAEQGAGDGKVPAKAKPGKGKALKRQPDQPTTEGSDSERDAADSEDEAEASDDDMGIAQTLPAPTKGDPALAAAESALLAARRAAGAAAGPSDGSNGSGSFRNKEKVLILSSRGIPHRHRHLMLDLAQLLPHAKKDFKLDTKSDRGVINEVADLKGCSSVLFFEARKKQDCYLWISKAPAGPCVKFHVANVHTMAELKLSGNHLKGSRPVLSFDKSFDSEPHLALLREMLRQVFATPVKHAKSKPFFDHVMSFHVADGRVWIRNYQVLPALDKKKVAADSVSLVEVGPRCCLNPIRVFAGSFGGPVIYENTSYVSPNILRAAIKRQKAGKYARKVAGKQGQREHRAENPMPRSELADVFR